MMFINETIGRRIRTQREKLGLKQHDIANALQVSPQAVSKWERGENAPDISLLVPLAQLLGVSTDNLLGYHENQFDVFDATVYFAVVDGYAIKSQTLPAKAVAAWANGFFFQLTEAVLQYDGIPVKYMGDTFLGFFSGPNHQQRAIQAAFQAKSIVSEPLTIALHSGEIYLGTIGHPDYSRPDIMGDTVNLAFMTMEWASHRVADQITATAPVVERLEHRIEIGTSHTIRLRGVEELVEIYELLRMCP
jgi:class 3 adenylate cyclase